MCGPTDAIKVLSVAQNFQLFSPTTIPKCPWSFLPTGMGHTISSGSGVQEEGGLSIECGPYLCLYHTGNTCVPFSRELKLNIIVSILCMGTLGLSLAKVMSELFWTQVRIFFLLFS